MDIFDSISYWHWWILAVILVILEMLAPGVFFMWMGMSAGIMGLLLLVLPINWKLQIFIFSVLSVISVLVGRNYLLKNPTHSDVPNLNKRGQQYIGQTFTLAEPIENGVGKVTVGDSLWRVEGQDRQKGEKVKVTGVKGSSFIVE